MQNKSKSWSCNTLLGHKGVLKKEIWVILFFTDRDMDFPAVYSHSTLVQNIFLPPFQEGQEIFLSREHMFPEMLRPWEEWAEEGCSCSQATERNVSWWPMWSVWAAADGALIRACLLSHFSLVQLFATPRTVAHLTPLIPQARILEWVAVPSSGGSSRLRDQTRLLHLPLWRAGSTSSAACKAQWGTHT